MPLRVLEAGLRSTVQDSGRWGYLRSAVPPSGPADARAFAAAQALVGNGAEDAAIEIVGLPFRFACEDRRVVAACGRDVRVRLREPLPGWTAIFARAGEEVVVEGSAATRYAYLAISGGVTGDAVLGSRATYMAAGIGPWPRPLRPGDALLLGPTRTVPQRAGTSVEAPRWTGDLRVLSGPHVARFPEPSLRRFAEESFRVGEGDRVGVRLEGPDIRPRPGELLTCGMVAGAIQVPHGGAPIVLLSDHQVTGGYPVIAVVIEADQWRVAQAAPGETLRFYAVRREDALAAWREERARLAAIA
jgi:biotin-dependent carboxylase-like uncharacterized protein